MYYGLPINDFLSSKIYDYTDAIAMVFVAPFVSSLSNSEKYSYITVPNDEVVAIIRKASSDLEI